MVCGKVKYKWLSGMKLTVRSSPHKSRLQLRLLIKYKSNKPSIFIVMKAVSVSRVHRLRYGDGECYQHSIMRAPNKRFKSQD